MIENEANELIGCWMNGNTSQVIDKLASEHPALAASVIFQGLFYKSLSLIDCKAISSSLIERSLE